MRFIQNAKRTVTLAGSLAAVGNSIVTSLATATTPTVLNGAGLTGTTGGVLQLSQNVTVTTTSSATTYDTTDPIVVKGTDINGQLITENLLLTMAGGGETVTGKLAFFTITEIDIPAQVTTSGAFTFGSKNYFPGAEVFEIRVKTAGSLHMEYQNLSTDTLSALAGDRLPYSPIKIFSDSTAQDVTLAFEI